MVEMRWGMHYPSLKKIRVKNLSIPNLDCPTQGFSFHLELGAEMLDKTTKLREKEKI